jgi:hypothetical protein
MGQQSSATVRHSENGFTVDAEFIAGKLGLSPEIFWREVKRGIVYGVVEHGEGEDVGRVRLTFRYRAISYSITLEDTLQLQTVATMKPPAKAFRRLARCVRRMTSIWAI